MLAGATQPEPEPEPVKAAEPAPTGGKLSQEQIEAMLAGAAQPEPEPEPEPVKAEEPAPTGGKLSQEQIEAMLAGADTAEPEPELAKEESASSGGTLSQEQIEAMLAGADTAEPESEPAKEESENAALSQAEIEKMLSMEQDAEPEPVQEKNETPALSQADIEKMLSLEEDAEPADEPTTAETAPEEKNQQLSQDQIAAMLGEDAVVATTPTENAETADKTEPESEAAEGTEQPAESEDNAAEKEAKAAQSAERKQKIKQVLAMVLPVAAVIAAGVVGFGASLIMNTDFLKSENEQFAIKSANAYNSSLPVNTNLCVYKAYVRKGAAADECMLYTLTETAGNTEEKICRVVVDHNSPDIIDLYYIIDPESPAYLALKSSSDPQTRIQASILKSYSDQIIASDNSIREGDTSWEKIDCSKINGNITLS